MGVDTQGRYPWRILCRFFYLFWFFFLQIRIKVLLCLGIRRFLLNFRYIEMKTHCFITFLFLVLCYCWSATGNYCWGKSSWHDDYCGSDDRYHGCYKGKCWKQCGQGGSYWCYMGEKEMTTSSHYKMRQIYCNAKQQDRKVLPRQYDTVKITVEFGTHQM